jgi:hypothetical protein
MEAYQSFQRMADLGYFPGQGSESGDRRPIGRPIIVTRDGVSYDDRGSRVRNHADALQLFVESTLSKDRTEGRNYNDEEALRSLPKELIKCCTKSSAITGANVWDEEYRIGAIEEWATICWLHVQGGISLAKCWK